MSFPQRLSGPDVHEKWLHFVDWKGEMRRFWPRLIKSAYQRDRALAEISIAFFLDTICASPIIDWEPNGEAGTKGEFLATCGAKRIFVEVKTGGWEKDIKEAEGKDSPRLRQPKYIHAEARSVGNWQVIRNAVSNGYKKVSQFHADPVDYQGRLFHTFRQVPRP
jgi:hypothetical protein